ncbi:hypothetical protein CRUP_027003, partial [Coryphaenoides rupestris]
MSGFSEFAVSPPTPQLQFKPLVCHQDQPCVVMCDVETLHLGPVTFYWRRNDGEWKNGSDLVVEWNAPDDMTYFGSYKNRALLNIETLQLDINHLTLADSATFSVETEKGTVCLQKRTALLPPPA